jgi:hypothetical protein
MFCVRVKWPQPPGDNPIAVNNNNNNNNYFKGMYEPFKMAILDSIGILFGVFLLVFGSITMFLNVT